MKVLFLTDLTGNSGSVNANRSIIKHWPKDDEVQILKSIKPLAGLCEALTKAIKSDVVISPGTRWFEMISHFILGFFKKPFVCFNHGYVPFENEINNLGYSRRKIRAIKRHLATSDLVVANSQFQAIFIERCQPDLIGKTNWSTLGIDRFEQEQKKEPLTRNYYIIAASGGTRRVKGNDIVVEALSKLRDRGVPFRFVVYGEIDKNDPLVQEYKGCEDIQFKGQVSQDLFIKDLLDVDLFVMNSRHDSFGLSAIDALSQGCSLLLSANCGVKEVLNLESTDIINDCEDEDEVALKIEMTLSNPNADRLYKSISFDQSSWSECSKKLRTLCANLIDRSRLQ